MNNKQGERKKKKEEKERKKVPYQCKNGGATPYERKGRRNEDQKRRAKTK
jgi:hypothetical protein